MAGYYKRFVERFFSIAVPLTHLTQKRVKFEQIEDYGQNFQELKRILVFAPILSIPLGSENIQFTVMHLERNLAVY